MDSDAVVIAEDTLDDAARACARAARAALSGEGVHIVHQPIVELDGGSVIGYEALARFEQVANTQSVFEGGHLFGFGAELEARLLELALEGARHLARGWRLHVNVSPSTLLVERVRRLFEQARLRKVVIELTEHVPPGAVRELERTLLGLRARGALIAVDDAGSGFGGMDLLLGLRPDLVKLDAKLVQGLGNHPGRAGVVRALVEAAHQSGAMVVAEGVEDATTLEACVRLGLDAAQGYWFARPAEGFPSVDPERLAGMSRVERRVLFGEPLAERLAPVRVVAASAPLRGDGVRLGVDALGTPVWVAVNGRGPLVACTVARNAGWHAVEQKLAAGIDAVVIVDACGRALGVVLGSSVDG